MGRAKLLVWLFELKARRRRLVSTRRWLDVSKPATLETGAVVQVLLFVNEGDTIRAASRERRYISRA